MSGVVVLLMLVATSLAGSGPQSVSIVASGLIRITTAPDGLSALVSVEAEQAKQAARSDGLVERAFLVQTAKPIRVAFAGQATLVFTTTHLAVMGMPGPTWVFSVSGKDTESVSASDDVTVIPVVGLSHYWGRLVDLTHDELVAKLLMRQCETGGRGSGCDSCEFGGPGESGCEIICPEGTCSASCGDGYHSCCSCTEGCRCCRNIEQRAAGSSVPPGRH
jgi:hypothetical protein